MTERSSQEREELAKRYQPLIDKMVEELRQWEEVGTHVVSEFSYTSFCTALFLDVLQPYLDQQVESEGDRWRNALMDILNASISEPEDVEALFAFKLKGAVKQERESSIEGRLSRLELQFQHHSHMYGCEPEVFHTSEAYY